MTTQTTHYQNEFSSAWSELPGYKTSWLDRLRLRAINEFTTGGFPPPKAEDWKYTDLDLIKDRSYSTGSTKPDQATRDKIHSLARELDEAVTIVFVDGNYFKTLNESDFPAGVKLISFKTAIEQRSVLMKDYLISHPDHVSAFEWLNTAFMNDGVYLSLQAETVLEKPIQILNVATAPGKSHVSYLHNLLVFGEHSRATLLERYVSLSDQQQHLTNVVTQTVLKSGATVDYIRVQDESTSSFHFAVQRAALAENAALKVHTFDFGGRLARYNLNLELNGQHAECQSNGLFMVDGHRQADNYALVEHNVPNCRSESNFRGVLNEQGKGVFRGKIKVHRDAQHTQAQLNNANLLLSSNAEINTMPQLEIDADDVKCNHGSSSGQLNEEQMFYLTSRGLDRAAAYNLLVFAFANATLDRMESETIKALVKDKLIANLLKGDDRMEFVQ